MSDTGAEAPIRLLLVEQDTDYANWLQLEMRGVKSVRFAPVHVDSLDRAVEHLKQMSFDMVLLELALSDSRGLDTFLRIQPVAADLPVVILTGYDDLGAATEAIHKGAQDYLIKGEISANTIIRSLLFSLERHKTWLTLQRLSLKDDLTGLLNRRGFLSLALHHVKIAQRENWKTMLLFADVDNLKAINDSYGHAEGDQVLRSVGDILRDTFRTSDLIARLGGDEFIAFAVNTTEDGAKKIISRLEEQVQQHNRDLQKYQLSISYGVAIFDPETELSLEEMIAQADVELYKHKHSKRRFD